MVDAFGTLLRDSFFEGFLPALEADSVCQIAADDGSTVAMMA